MTAGFIIYIAKSAIVLAVLHSLYGLCLRRETLHTLNRAVLLFIMAAAVALPAVRVTTGSPSALTLAAADAEAFITEQAYAAPAPGMAEAVAAAPDGGRSLALWPRVVAVAYAAGLAVCLLGYALSLLQLWRMIWLGRQMTADGLPRGVRVVECPGLAVPCSWMRWVLLPPAPGGGKLCAVLTHELAHVRLGHSWDMILCELVTRLLWFLPSAWMLRKDLRDVHEYQADSRVLSAGIDADGYQRLLIKTAAQPAAATAANSFCRSAVKRRLYMMCRRPSARAAALKAAYLLPLVGVAVAAFARPAIVGEAGETLARAEADAPLLSPRALVEAAKPRTKAPATPGQPAAPAPEPMPEGVAVALTDTSRLRPDSTALRRMADVKPARAARAAVRDTVTEVMTIPTAPFTMLEFARMKKLRHGFWVETSGSETRVMLLWPIYEDPQRISIDATGSYIYDTATGDRYMCRRIEGYGSKRIDLRVKSHRGALACFTLVFPRLDESVRNVMMHCPHINDETVFRLKDISREPVRVIR